MCLATFHFYVDHFGDRQVSAGCPDAAAKGELL